MGLIPPPIWTPSHSAYHAEPRWSSSRLKRYRKSPRGAYLEFVAGQKPEEKRTWSLTMGSVVNAIMLRPDSVKLEVEVVPVDSRRAVAYKKLQALYPEREVVTEPEWEEAQAIAQAILQPQSGAASLARELLLPQPGAVDPGFAEYAFRWDDESGAPCKAMLDRLRGIGYPARPLYVELKSSRDCSPDSFSRDIVTYGYDAQGAFNARGVRHLIGEEPAVIWVVVENEHPFDVAVYQCSNEFRVRGMQITERTLLELQARLDGRLPWAAEWQLVTDRIPTILPPTWAQRELRDGMPLSLIQ